MDSKVTYKQQVSYCGKPQCSKCREGIGHGPYWYAYHTSEQGRTVRTYVGKRLPVGVQGSQITQVAQVTQIPQKSQKSQTADVQARPLPAIQKDVSLLTLVDERIAQEAFSTAIEPLDRLIASNPTNEAAVQRLIFVLARLKRRGEAIRAYQKFSAALKSRHNTIPSIGTYALVEAVQRGDDPLEMPGNPEGAETGGSRPHPTLDEEHSRSLSGGAISNVEGIPGVEEDADVIHRSLRGYEGKVGRIHQRELVGRETEQATMREFVFTTMEDINNVNSGYVVGAEFGSHFSEKKGNSLPLDTQRRSQWLLLSGEAGIGKTRLVEEVGGEAQQQGWGVVWSRMYAQESSIPYRQWIEILRNAALQGLWQMHEIEQHSDVFVPLGVLLPELYASLPHPPSLSPEQEQQRLWEAVLALFTLMSRQRPLLVVLDDLQWADSSSCELLGYLARRLSGQPVQFIGACRESELAPNHVLHGLIAHMQREHTITTLAIEPMTDVQIRMLVGHLSEDMVGYIQRQAAGNPFFAEELALSTDVELTDFSVLPALPASPTSSALPDGRQAVARRKHFTLPENIRVALDHRISKLSRPCQQLLSNAAVMGGSFEFTLIRAMEAYGANQKDEDTILDLLDEALQAGVLAEEGSGTHIHYHFWHPLLVSHLYERLSASKRALLHRRVAEILQQLYALREEEGAATITYHLVEGGAEDERIAHFAELAGNSAYILSAYPDVVRYYHLVLEHSSAEPAYGMRRAFLLERLGECARIQGHFDDAQHFYEQILAERGKRTNLPMQGSWEDLQREAQIEALLWCEVGWSCYYTGDKTRAIACRERGEQVLRAAGVARGSAWATLRYQQGFISWQEGNYDEAHVAASEAQRLFEEALQQQQSPDGQETFSTRIRRTLAGDTADLARIHRLLGSIANSVGRPSEGLAHLNTALSIFEEHEQKRDVGHACCNIGYIHLQKAEYEQAQAFFGRSLSLAEQVGDTPLTSVVYSNLGIQAARTGRLTEAEEWLRRGLALAEQINDQVYVSMWNTLLSDVFQQQGKLSEAQSCLCHALMLGRRVGNIPCTGLALVAAGTLRIAEAKTAEKSRDMAQRGRYLKRASKTLQRALALEGLEAETRAEGQLAMAQVALLLGNEDDALQQASAVLANAQAHELTWLVERTQEIIRDIHYAM
ncbi:MAG: AAA family ATPase [Ktedonobacteraceae bacterium]